MEQPSISRSVSTFSPKLTASSSVDNANAVHGDRSSLGPLSPKEIPGLTVLLSSKVNADFVAGDLSPGVHSHKFAEISMKSGCSTICTAPCDAVKDTKEPEMPTRGDCALVAAANGKPSEPSGSVLPELRVFLKEATGSKVLGAAPGKPTEKIDSIRKDFGCCSLEIELIDDTALIGIELKGAVFQNGKRERKPRRRHRAPKNDSDENRNSSNLNVSTGNKRAEKAKKIVYSRKAMESLRFWDIKGQRKRWSLIYSVFSPAMKTEYEDLVCSGNQKRQSGLICDTNNRAPPILAAAQGGCLNGYVRQDNFSGVLSARRNIV